MNYQYEEIQNIIAKAERRRVKPKMAVVFEKALSQKTKHVSGSKKTNKKNKKNKKKELNKSKENDHQDHVEDRVKRDQNSLQLD